MAPAQSPNPGFTLVHHVLQRADAILGQDHSLGDTLPYHRRQKILMTISISLASVSVLAAFSAFYWFVRMRRSFRQDLIMLLIQSDMMKAMWLVLCPLVYFSTSSLDNEYYFCQVSGFLLTAAIEASDIAVLMIAVHQALYVLNSHEGGLYPYRKIAYIIWAVLPIVIAAIVPISGGQFTANGPNCYLPVHPEWYRQALSWGPRYFIFGLISVIYASVYLYVGLRFRRFGKVQRSTSTMSPMFVAQPANLALQVPPTPSIMDHGLLDSARDSLSKSIGKIIDERQDSVVSTASTKYMSERQNPGRRPTQPGLDAIAWNLHSFKQHHDDSSEGGQARTQPVSRHGPEEIEPAALPTRPARTAQRSATQSQAVAQHREAALVALTRSVSAPVDTTTTPSSFPWHKTPTGTTPLDGGVIHLSADATDEVMRRSRERTHRQLRLLVVYPIIYVISWIAPFVSHVVGYDDYASATRSGPLELQIASIASFCIGAAVDCCFFMGWEKPWRELQGGFWEGLASRLGSAGRFFAPSERFQPHVQRDARMAHFRRAQENIDRGLLAAAMSKAPPRRPREWWDDVDMDIDGVSRGDGRRPVSYHLGGSESRRDLQQ
ncbi:G protein-coupled glucose receptor regulating Gpa2-domain-containing protein [Microdochium trichocladiopsis]|uniref:G protein-coupled glucose receptor regulating Gpa2-domain-containing protein n=1 Tax=Microdochium trichocladiopsis TaxID=1682393 RepID=A0A9P8Y8A6_9PEZI|nr:G protein-coupled glucose receptor regulating Gpa2-domain-containing protein [Microdochium trichocladiopsis]KAH7031523.1 G protein-coupled glucose receptor regulating Gpa2-domain-containing protein [Microdochium trichocladiopsis]